MKGGRTPADASQLDHFHDSMGHTMCKKGCSPSHQDRLTCSEIHIKLDKLTKQAKARESRSSRNRCYMQRKIKTGKESRAQAVRAYQLFLQPPSMLSADIHISCHKPATCPCHPSISFRSLPFRHGSAVTESAEMHVTCLRLSHSSHSFAVLRL